MGPSFPDGSSSGAGMPSSRYWAAGTPALRSLASSLEDTGCVKRPQLPPARGFQGLQRLPRPLHLRHRGLASPPQLTATLPWAAWAVSSHEHGCFCLLQTELSSQLRLASIFLSDDRDNVALLATPPSGRSRYQPHLPCDGRGSITATPFASGYFSSA